MTRIGLFIDYSNLWASTKATKVVIDFEKLISYLELRFSGTVEVKYIYFAYPEAGTRPADRDLSGIHKFGAMLEKRLWFKVCKKPLKQIRILDETWKPRLNSDGTFDCIEKWNLDTELTIDVVRYSDLYDEMVIFSGDSDFLPLIAFLLEKDKHTHVFSTSANISRELRFWWKTYTDIGNIPEIFRNSLNHKKTPS